MSSNLKPKYLYGAFPFAQCPARGGSQLKGLRAHGPWGPWRSMGPMGLWVKFETLNKQYKNKIKFDETIMKYIGAHGSIAKLLCHRILNLNTYMGRSHLLSVPPGGARNSRGCGPMGPGAHGDLWGPWGCGLSLKL